MPTVPARLTPFGLILLLGAMLLSGCGAGDTVDPQKTQLALQYNVEEATGEKVAEVTCPENVPVSVGTRFTCHVIAESGDDAVAELEVTSKRADLRVLSLKAP